MTPALVRVTLVGQMVVGAREMGRMALGAHMYAADYNNRIPRSDNNGSCVYGDYSCARPDWGNARDDDRDPGARPMFANQIFRYLTGGEPIYSPVIGPVDWETVVTQGIPGINFGRPYDPTREDVYYGVAAQYAVNMMLIERWGSIATSIAWSGRMT